MSIFNPKPKPPAQLIEPMCNHKWKDFNWYTTGKHLDNGLLEVRIYEPYVCIHCKARKDVLLEATQLWVRDYKDCFRALDEYTKQYGNRIQDRAIIEDQINDFQLVDREYLRLAEYVYNVNGKADKKL